MGIENRESDPEMTLNIRIEEDSGAIAPSEEIATETGTEPEAGQAQDPHTAADPLDTIKKQIENLAHAFESKIKYDRHKEKIIDDLHHALQEYRQGILKKYLQRIFIDIIKIVDDIKKFTAYYQDQPEHNAISRKLLQYLESIASDLEDLFSWEGVVPFTCEGDQLDPARQRVVSRIETEDPEKDKKIADRLRPGYEWDGRVIRPEMVAIYVNNGIATDANPSAEEEKIR